MEFPQFKIRQNLLKHTPATYRKQQVKSVKSKDINSLFNSYFVSLFILFFCQGHRGYNRGY